MNYLDFLTAPTIVGIVAATIYGLFELFARRRERMALIEKLTEIKNLGSVEGKIDFTFGKSFSYWALRGGCLLIGLGLGIVIGYLITFNVSEEVYVTKMESTVFSGCILLFGGLGLLLAFILEMKYFRKQKN